MKRYCGVLLSVTSLPSRYGIGCFDKAAYDFVDWLEKAGQRYWQILPLGSTSHTGAFDSPYQAYSAFAGNAYFISLDALVEEGVLTEEECASAEFGGDPGKVDYELLFRNRLPLLHKAYERSDVSRNEAFKAFCQENFWWLDDYALFMALKDAHGGVAWFEWEKELKTREEKALLEAKETYAEDIMFYKMLQYLFFRQWWSLKKYVNEKGIEIIGDVPIYVAGDSADVWANPSQFYLDENLDPIDVAGCPPDAFSEDGQLWGNPLFRWDVMKQDDYTWWTRRVKAMSKLYDIVRIDHFRGFDSYYAIPGKDKTARNGEWREGPGMDLFNALERKLGKLNIIVEDLGYLTPSVMKLVKDSGFPGMKVVQFAFDSREGSDYLPHNYPKHCVVYTGTHDNDTILGWMKTAPKESVKFAKEYLNLTKEEGYNWGMMRGAWASVGDLAIVPMQDLIGIDSKGRMNTPSTLGGNWQWRATADQIDGRLAKRLYKYTKMYGRVRTDE